MVTDSILILSGIKQSVCLACLCLHDTLDDVCPQVSIWVSDCPVPTCPVCPLPYHHHANCHCLSRDDTRQWKVWWLSRMTFRCRWALKQVNFEVWGLGEEQSKEGEGQKAGREFLFGLSLSQHSSQTQTGLIDLVLVCSEKVPRSWKLEFLWWRTNSSVAATAGLTIN